MHHLDSWIKRDQLDVTCFIISLLTAEHVSDVNTSILRSLRLIWWVISWVVLFWFDVCWCYVVVWLGWCGIRMQVSAFYSQHTEPALHFVIKWIYNLCLSSFQCVWIQIHKTYSDLLQTSVLENLQCCLVGGSRRQTNGNITKMHCSGGMVIRRPTTGITSNWIFVT